MKSYIRKIISLCILLLGLSLCAGCSGEKGDEITWSRHAFLLEDDLIFIADIPEDWRYVLRPVYNYLYYKELVIYDGNYHAAWSGSNYAERYVEFLGRTGEYDGLDNFFRIYASRDGFQYIEDQYRYDEESALYYYRLESGVTAQAYDESFVFADGTQGEWQYWISDEEETIPYSKGMKNMYRGIVYDTGRNFGVGLWMLQSEYAENEPVIKHFLESGCFRTSDLGISEEPDILKRDLLTLHIWNEYMCMTLSVPEGISIERSGDNIVIYLDEANTILFYPDLDADMLEPSGDFDYFLSSEDFKETVYEIPYNGYYFANQYIMMFLHIDEDSEDLQQLAKKIAQSVCFQ